MKRTSDCAKKPYLRLCHIKRKLYLTFNKNRYKMAYKTGIDRTQINLFPICIDESISQDNVVRVLDAFVEWLDLASLGFQHTTDNLKGTSVYPPSMLLKLYLYGYLNRIRSSRRLALECERNIELHWLLNRMTPQYHTIADFRKDNPDALKGVFKEFTQFCIAMSLIEGETVAIDGTKIRAQNNQKNNFNAARLEKLLTRMDTKTHEYEQYLKELDNQDTQETAIDSRPIASGKTKEEIDAALALLKARRTKYQDFQKQLQELADNGGTTEDLQISTVDPDARSLPFKQRQTEVGYNVQTVGDAKHSLIVHFDVTNVGDSNALSALTLATKEILHLEESQTFDALADAGYHNGSELAQCAEQGILTYVCPTDVAIAQSKITKENPTYTKEQFIYDAQTDTYTCPNQEKLTSNGTWYVHKATSKRKKDRKYKQYTLPSKTCQACPFAEQCQGNRYKNWHGKTIERTEFDEAVEANRKRLALKPQAYKQRKEIIEHPFGTIKRSWGYSYTLVKTKKKVGGEFALIFLCYNLRRVISVLGTLGLKNALKNHFSFLCTVFKPFTDIFLKSFKCATKIALPHITFKLLFNAFFSQNKPCFCPKI